ncbi:MAG: hypothetical protein V7641_2892 [Blastocatellia bacterium]
MRGDYRPTGKNDAEALLAALTAAPKRIMFYRVSALCQQAASGYNDISIALLSSSDECLNKACGYRRIREKR